MQDKTNSPAMKYFDIKSARELIDGIWDKSSIQKRMLTQSITDTQIIFFSPYANTRSYMNFSVQKSRDTLLNGLFLSTSNGKIVSYFAITEEQCERAFDKINNTARAWYVEKALLFHKSDMEGWYIYSVIHKMLTKVHDYPKFSEVLTNMQMQSFIYDVDMIDFMDISSVLVTALIILYLMLNLMLRVSIYQLFIITIIICRICAIFHFMIYSKDIYEVALNTMNI